MNSVLYIPDDITSEIKEILRKDEKILACIDLFGEIVNKKIISETV